MKRIYHRHKTTIHKLTDAPVIPLPPRFFHRIAWLVRLYYLGSTGLLVRLRSGSSRACDEKSLQMPS
jgi:hypothetical protein